MSSSPNSQEIVILGAGELGSAFLPHLLALPSTNVTLAIRSPSKYTHLQTTYPTLSLIPLDLSAPSHNLIPQFAEYDVIISATGFGQTPSTLTKLAREVIKASTSRLALGVPKIWFFPWQWGVDYDITHDVGGLMPLFGAQKDVRDILRGSEDVVEWSVVSTGIFMSFLFEAFWGIVTNNSPEEKGGEKGKVKVRALRDWKHGVTVTHVHDIGRVLGRILAGDVDAKNKVVYVAGDTVNYGELAEIVSRVTGGEVQREVWSVEDLKEEVARDPDDGIKKYRLAFAGEGVSWDKEGTVNKELGMEMIGVDEYARNVVFGK